MRRSRPLLACVIALLLVFAQQAALSHLISHLGSQHAAQTIADHEDRGHGNALSLTHSCATCVALATLGGPPAAAFAIDLIDASAVPAFAVPSQSAPSQHTAVYEARAPPKVF